MRVNFQTLGCRLNEAELQHWAEDFIRDGHEVVTEPENADLLVVNTCAVTREAGRKSRQMVRRARRSNPAAKLVVSGCYATLEQQQTAAMEGVDLVVPNRHKRELLRHVRRNLDMTSMPALAQRPAEVALFQRGRSRAFIKVQDGCRWRCTYCIVTVARGEERSTPVHDIVEQVNRHVAQGIKEVVLTGVHLGGYGSDTGSNLYTLTRAILEETDVVRVRFGSLEPWDLHEEFFGLFDNHRVMPHLHLPLQSGSDSVLRRMARRCKTAEFAVLVSQARQYIPDFNVSTDIIAGFPGETAGEWREGLRFIESVGFGHTHIFSYSARAGTKAATLPGMLPTAEIRKRSRELHTLAEQMRHRYLARFDGRKMPVLLEDRIEPVGEGRYCYQGYTPNYLKVSVELHGPDMGNQIINIGLEIKEDKLQGRLAN